MPPEARASVFWTRYISQDKEGQREMMKWARKIPGVWSERFARKYKQLRKKWSQSK
jgi:hypothetical protein